MISSNGGARDPASGTRFQNPHENLRSSERNRIVSSPGGAVSPGGRSSSVHSKLVPALMMDTSAEARIPVSPAVFVVVDGRPRG
jgi:hypothetical protein